jgi:hypothetical protein
MPDSTFWKKLAEKFRALPIEYKYLRAEKTIFSNEIQNAKWRLIGNIAHMADFETLARRGASRMAKNPNPDLLDLWIEKISKEVPDTHDGTTYGETTSKGTVIQSSVTYTLHLLPHRSVTYCKAMESRAIQKEFDSSLTKDREPPPTPAAPPSQQIPALASQIQRLRLECKWSIEVLAAKTGFDNRTVGRHLSGETKPHLRNIGTYEQAFSKALKREVVINNLP